MKIDYLNPHNANLRRAYKRDIDAIKKHITSGIVRVFDVGANTGGTTLELRGGFPGAEIHAFEPLNGNFKQLVDVTAGKSDIYTYNIGFSSEDKDGIEVGMPVVNGKPHNYGRTTLYYHTEHGSVDTINVRKLSKWCVETEIYPDLLWMDIEGSEYDVICDLIDNNLLHSIPYIYVEINPTYPESSLIPTLLDVDYEKIHISGDINRKTSAINYLFKRRTEK